MSASRRAELAGMRLDVMEVGLLLDELFRVHRLGLDSATIMGRLLEWRLKRDRKTSPDLSARDHKDCAQLVEALGLDVRATTEEAVARIDHLVALSNSWVRGLHGDEQRQGAIDEGARLARELGQASSDFERGLLTEKLLEWASDVSPRTSPGTSPPTAE